MPAAFAFTLLPAGVAPLGRRRLAGLLRQRSGLLLLRLLLLAVILAVIATEARLILLRPERRLRRLRDAKRSLIGGKSSSSSWSTTWPNWSRC